MALRCFMPAKLFALSCRTFYALLFSVSCLTNANRRGQEKKILMFFLSVLLGFCAYKAGDMNS